MRQLTEDEKKYYADLGANMEKHVEAYRKKKQSELEIGKQAELESELLRLQEYLAGCRRGEISEMLVNIRFIERKIAVLQNLLDS